MKGERMCDIIERKEGVFMKKENIALHTGLAFALTLTVISLSVVFTLAFRPLYYLDMHLFDLSEKTGYSEEKILENYDELIDYNLSFSDSELKLPSLPMSSAGRIHFQEVKDIFDVFKYLAAGGAVLCSVWIWRMKKKKEYTYLKLTAVLTLALPLLTGAFVAADWDQAFTAFHTLAFNNDYWIFDPARDPVINILPDVFFLHCALLILAGIAAGSAICAVLYRKEHFALRRERSRS